MLAIVLNKARQFERTEYTFSAKPPPEYDRQDFGNLCFFQPAGSEPLADFEALGILAALVIELYR